jgi:peptidoglycan/xylan/chitin deacetylase (PgdA/CDA1 family)
MFFVRTPRLLQWMFSDVIWSLPNSQNAVSLTFDDGPHPHSTPWILEQLRQHGAKAAFFCLGTHAEKYPELIRRIAEEGHAVCNHGYEHLDGWKISKKRFLENALKGKEVLKTDLFRPPYGKFRPSVLKEKAFREIKFINWTLMSGDFDPNLNKEQCMANLDKARSGDIICLHDSEKAMKHLGYILPAFLSKRKFSFENLASVINRNSL